MYIIKKQNHQERVYFLINALTWNKGETSFYFVLYASWLKLLVRPAEREITGSVLISYGENNETNQFGNGIDDSITNANWSFVDRDLFFF